MKKTKFRNQNNTDSRKKMVLKFRDFDEEFEFTNQSMKRKKNCGKRKHRQKTLKNMFYTNDIDNNLIF